MIQTKKKERKLVNELSTLISNQQRQFISNDTAENKDDVIGVEGFIHLQKEEIERIKGTV